MSYFGIEHKLHVCISSKCGLVLNCQNCIKASSGSDRFDGDMYRTRTPRVFS